MGETDNVQQGVQTSGGQDGSTSEQETPTLTKSQVDEAVKKATSDVKAELGRMKKTLNDSTNIAQSAIARATKFFEELEESVKDDPAKLTAIRDRKRAFDSDIKVQSDRHKFEQEITEIKEYRAEKLAEKYNVEASIILKFGGDSKDSMEDLAKSFGERKAAETKTEDNATQTTKRMTTAPDSGKTKGGGGSLTKEQIQNMLPEEQNRRQSELAKMSFGSS